MGLVQRVIRGGNLMVQCGVVLWEWRFRMLKHGVALLLLTGVAALGADQASDSAKVPKSRPRIRIGGISVNAGYTHYSGGYPGFYGYGFYPRMWGYGSYFYDPFVYSYFLHPGFYTGFGYQPSMGEVKVRAEDPKAWVYSRNKGSH